MDQLDLRASKGDVVVAVVIVSPVLAAITVACRLYTRVIIIKNAALDDYFSVVGLIFSVATSVCMCYEVQNGLGRHIQTLTQEEGVNLFKALFASIILYNFSLLFIKLSILFQYLRICTFSRIRRACYAVIVFVIIYGIETFFTGLFTCYPVAKFWDDAIPGHCVNKVPLWFANAGLNIASDLMLLILPGFILSWLTTKSLQKAWLVLIIGLGGFACIASIFRLHALYIAVSSKDVTWDNPPTIIWSSLELNVGLIGASLGTLKPLMARFFPSLVGMTKESSGGNSLGENVTFGQGQKQTISSSRPTRVPDLVEDDWDYTDGDKGVHSRGSTWSGKTPVIRVSDSMI